MLFCIFQSDCFDWYIGLGLEKDQKLTPENHGDKNVKLRHNKELWI